MSDLTEGPLIIRSGAAIQRGIHRKTEEHEVTATINIRHLTTAEVVEFDAIKETIYEETSVILENGSFSSKWKQWLVTFKLSGQDSLFQEKRSGEYKKIRISLFDNKGNPLVGRSFHIAEANVPGEDNWWSAYSDNKRKNRLKKVTQGGEEE